MALEIRHNQRIKINLVLSGGGDPLRSKRETTQAELQNLQAALESYYVQFGEYPEPADHEESG